MTQAPSLAKHLDHAARLHGETIALHGDGRTWTFAELLTGTRLLATTLGTGTQPLNATGNSHHLAHLAYAASFENRPFWPVDRSKALPDKVLCPPETALIISTSGSEGQPRSAGSSAPHSAWWQWSAAPALPERRAASSSKLRLQSQR